MSVGGGRPGETFKMKCVFKGDDVALFKGSEVEPEHDQARISLTGNVQYFSVGKEYAIVFQPIEH